jgi:hypothetical protein
LYPDGINHGKSLITRRVVHPISRRLARLSFFSVPGAGADGGSWACTLEAQGSVRCSSGWGSAIAPRPGAPHDRLRGLCPARHKPPPRGSLTPATPASRSRLPTSFPSPLHRGRFPLAESEILGRPPHPEQGYRSCLGILRLAKRYGPERLEAACARADAVKARSYRHVDSILKHGLDRLPPPAAAVPLTLTPVHEHLWGRDYYQ